MNCRSCGASAFRLGRCDYCLTPDPNVRVERIDVTVIGDPAPRFVENIVALEMDLRLAYSTAAVDLVGRGIISIEEAKAWLHP